jgi:phospholipid/cholesterol/gamma-HCH transport system substrate-binding protein
VKSRKGLIAALLVVAIVLVVVFVGSGADSGGGYVVRGIFDNGSFMVKGEQVRIAGAVVGEVESVGVTMPGEVDSYENGHPEAIPGKAVIAMKIEKAGFQDFRQDANCIIRPQSLIGEKYVDCRPTLPRPPGTSPPPPLRVIKSGQPGAGQRLLPLENNSTSVDPDLINDIHTLPYAQRFRLIFNELGATFAGRGSDVKAAVERANPVLREADRVIEILNNQRDQLAQLASDSNEVLTPLTAQKAHVAGFLANAGIAGQATGERGAELEASLQKFPQFLREFRETMTSLKGFSDAGTPVLSNLDQATPALTEATRNLAPFTTSSTIALKSLGNAGEAAGPIFRKSDKVVVKARDLARSGVGPTTNLAKFLVSTKKTKGWNYLVKLIYNGTGAVNQFDENGHLIQSVIALTNCLNYEITPGSGCHSTFGEGAGASVFNPEAMLRRIAEMETEKSGGISALHPEQSGYIAPSTSTEGSAPELGESEQLGEEEAEAEAEELGARVGSPAQRALLNYLLGP